LKIVGQAELLPEGAELGGVAAAARHTLACGGETACQGQAEAAGAAGEHDGSHAFSIGAKSALFNAQSPVNDPRPRG